MELRNQTTGEIITDRQFRALHPNTSFPAVIDYAKWGYDVIFEGPQATGGTVYQYSMRQGIEQLAGKWYTKYVLGPIFQDIVNDDGTIVTAAEQEAEYKANKDSERGAAIRADRNRRLADCDWTQLPDAPADSAAWAAYRQALRDVTSQDGFPWDVVWPEPPA
jgi:hypothetical protein